MGKLIKTDLLRIFKDKLFLVACILGVVFALFIPLLYKLLFGIIDLGMEELAGVFNVNAKTIFFEAFMPSSNFALVLPVLISIILCKDFSYGTIRNKIIGGHSRKNIVISTCVSCALVTCALMLLHGLLTLGFSLMFFEYQDTSFTINDFWYALESVAFEILVYALVSAMITFICMSVKNVGGAIVVYIAVNLLMSIVGSIVATALMGTSADSGFAYNVLEFLNNANVFAAMTIGQTAYGVKEVLHLLIPNLIMTALFVVLGIVIFNKKDIK